MRRGPALSLDLGGAAAVRGRGVRALGHSARGLEGGRRSGGHREHARRGVPLRAEERGGARVAAARTCPRGRCEAEGARAHKLFGAGKIGVDIVRLFESVLGEQRKS